MAVGAFLLVLGAVLLIAGPILRDMALYAFNQNPDGLFLGMSAESNWVGTTTFVSLIGVVVAPVGGATLAYGTAAKEVKMLEAAEPETSAER